MPPRHPLSRVWLMTDERTDLWRAIRRLPRGAGVVFRHHATPLAERRRLWRRLRREALARGLVLVRAGAMPLPGEIGVHKGARGAGLRTRPVHDVREAREARRSRVDAVFVSPVFATRSHPGAEPLGKRRAAGLARVAGSAAVALGGVDAQRARGLPRVFVGWAAIDAWR